MRRIYLDNNATTPVLPEVVAAMQPWWTERFGNASAVHSHGRDAREAVDHAREQVAALIGARPNEIIFTGSGTEADNQAIFGTLVRGDHLVTTSIEHHAVLHAAQEAEQRGVALTVVDPDRNGSVQLDTVRSAMRSNTKLVSVMLANNETGVLQPVREIAEVAQKHGALLHTDAVQCGGKLPIRVRDLRCDLLSLSAHKMHAPQGVGALWVRRGLQIRPLLYGGPHERQRRAGTENVPGIVGFGEAASLAAEWLATRSVEHGQLRARFERDLLSRVAGTTIHGADVARLPNTTSVRFDGVDAEALVIALDLQDVSISGGSACTSGAVEPSHVLRAMGLSDAEARSTVRISMSRLTTADEIAKALEIIVSTVERLRLIGSAAA